MVSALLYKCLIIFYTSKCCRADENLGWGENITKLYELVSSAVKNDLDYPVQTRRVFINDSQYQIHLNKLKDVNGIKFHNIVITRSGPEINSTIYINNPLEAKLPHPFMSLEEFKNTLVKQQIKDREEFMKAKKKAEHSRIWANIKATAKLKTKRHPEHKELHPTKSIRVNFKTTVNKNTPERLQKYNAENNSEPKIDNNNIKSTKSIHEIHELQNMSDKTDKLSSGEVNISSAVNFRVKLLATEQTLPLNNNPPKNKSHDNIIGLKSIDSENQSVDSIPNSTTKLNSVDEERTSSVEALNTGKEPTSSTIIVETAARKVADNEDGPITIKGSSTNKIDSTTTDKADEELTNITGTTKTSKVDVKPTNITDTSTTVTVDGKTTNITDTTTTDKVDGKLTNITDTSTTAIVDGETTNITDTSTTGEVDGEPTNIADTTTTDEVDGEPTNIADTTTTDEVDGEPTNVTDTTTDEGLRTGADDQEVTDADETEETSPEEEATETSTTVSTPSTTRVRWSRPRVFGAGQTESSTAST